MTLSDIGEKIFKMKYSHLGKESWEEAIWRVSDYISGAELHFSEKRDDPQKFRYEIAAIYYNLIKDLYLLPGGRVLSNAGTNIKNLANCYVLPMEDSRMGIYSSLMTAAELFANGGGVGYNFSKLREEGAPVKGTHGKASGPLSFMMLFDLSGEIVKQSSRRGAQMAVLNVNHPDVEKFISFKAKPNEKSERVLNEYDENLKRYANGKLKNTKYFDILSKTLLDEQLTHFNVSVLITDEFMKAVEEDGDWDLLGVLDGEVKKTVKARELFSLMAGQAWESGDPGLLFYDRINQDNMVPYIGDITATNPCVTGDTKIVTVYEGNKEIKDLVGRDVLVYTWNPETKLPEISTMRNIRVTRKNSDLVRVTFDSGLSVKCTPDHNFYSFRGKKVRAKDLKEGQSIRAFSMSKHKDGHIRVHGWVDGKAKHQYVARMIWEYHYGPIPDDLILHHRDFNETNNALDNFELVTQYEHNKIHYPLRRANGFFKRRNHKVLSVEKLNYKEDVYNGIVENTHSYIIADDEPIAGIVSGIVSANCGEIPLLPFEPCDLASINLHKFVYINKQGKYDIDFPMLEYAIRFGIRFLDDVQELSEVSIDEVNHYSKGLRRLGLGVMGWADTLAELMIPYESEAAKNLAEYLSWFIAFFSWLESLELARERGAFPLYEKDKVNMHVVNKVLEANSSFGKFDLEDIKEKGVRNVAVNAIAPTGSLALLAGVNSSIEPFFGLSYRRNITEGIGNTAKDFVIELNPILFRKLKEFNYSDEDIEEIKKHIVKFGSAKDCRLLDSTIKEVFKISNEISIEGHLTAQESWQKYLSNSTSKTINMASTATRVDVEEAYLSAWKRGLKGITIYRDNSKSFQILNLGSSE